MDHRKSARVLGPGIAALCLVLMMPAPADAQGQVAAFGESMVEQFREWTGWEDDGNSPMTVKQIACLIDCLDKKLFKYGKIAVKSPDVFGQNRMTGYRADYEDQMKSQLGAFELILSSYQRQSDSAALTSATSVAAALQAPRVANSRNVSTTTTNNVTPPTLAIPLTGQNGLFTNASTLVGSASPDLQPSAITSLTLANTGARQGIGLEPTQVLDERSNYLYHLNQLRRINAGGDSADVAGYGLYLMRMPVSLLPSGDAVEGKGASVTVRARHNVTPDLLANTFRNVVIFETAYSLADILDRGLLLLPKRFSDPAQDPTVAGAGIATAAAIERHAEIAGAPISSMGYQAQPRHQEMIAAAANSSGNLSGASGNAPVTDIVKLYGPEYLDILVTALKDDEKTWYRHDPSIVSWLSNECNAAYGYMRDQAHRNNPLFQPVVFEQVAQLVLQRRYASLKDFRDNWIKNLRMSRGVYTTGSGQVARAESLDILCFALIVQSVYLDRQIKYDMEFLSQRKGCACGDPWDLSFYDLYPATPEDVERYERARAAFAAYVECKWPIHIFAIDPVIDQQNQLDLFSQRTQLQLALAIALASGQVNFQNATSYARRTELDLATVALNRTSVGFGAGDATFGWQFYPRIQTPPLQSNPRRVLGILINNGPGPDYALEHRKIEPGLRECYALVVMPSFVPSIRFTSTANWFDLKTKCAEQVLETTDMVRLGKKYQAARNGLAHACDSGQYRPDELEMLADRLSQLEDMLPLKTHNVDIPFEASLMGSEIFSSTPTGLAPRLLAWYGEPPREGEASSIFLLGTAFTVYETYVTAGGVPITNDGGAKNLELFSRNVMRIQVPGTARAIETTVPVQDPDGTWRRRKVMDVHVATPNGISNHLLVEVLPKAAAAQAPAPAATTKVTYALLKKDDPLPPGYVVVPLGVSPDGAKIDLTWPAAGGAPPPTADVQLTFPNALVVGGADLVVNVPALPGQGSTFTLNGSVLATLSADLVSQVANVLAPNTAGTALTASKITLTAPGGKPQNATAAPTPVVLTLEGTPPVAKLKPAKFPVYLALNAQDAINGIKSTTATPDLTLDWLASAPQVEIVSLTLDFTANSPPNGSVPAGTLVFTDADFTMKNGARTILKDTVATKLGLLLAGKKVAAGTVWQARAITIKAQLDTATALAPVVVNSPFEIDFYQKGAKVTSLDPAEARPIAARFAGPSAPASLNTFAAPPRALAPRAGYDASLARASMDRIVPPVAPPVTPPADGRVGARMVPPPTAPVAGLPPLPATGTPRAVPAPAGPGRAAKPPERPRRTSLFRRLTGASQ